MRIVQQFAAMTVRMEGSVFSHKPAHVRWDLQDNTVNMVITNFVIIKSRCYPLSSFVFFSCVLNMLQQQQFQLWRSGAITTKTSINTFFNEASYHKHMCYQKSALVIVRMAVHVLQIILALVPRASQEQNVNYGQSRSNQHS